jgi:hypothetical protein
MEADQFISNAAAELEMVEAQLRDVEARATALRTRGEGLRFLIQYGQEAQAGAKAQGFADGTPSVIRAAAAAIRAAGTAAGGDVPQTDRVQSALTEIARAALTGEIRDRVNADGKGPDLAIEQVRSALGYLMRKRPPCVERVRPGVWRLPKAAPSPAAFTPTPLAVVAGVGSRGES